MHNFTKEVFQIKVICCRAERTIMILVNFLNENESRGSNQAYIYDEISWKREQSKIKLFDLLEIAAREKRKIEKQTHTHTHRAE